MTYQMWYHSAAALLDLGLAFMYSNWTYNSKGNAQISFNFAAILCYTAAVIQIDHVFRP